MAGLLTVKTAYPKAAASAHAIRKVVTGTAPRTVTTVTGPPIAITHGVVQVRITVVAGLITDIAATSLPHDNDISWDRSRMAATMLADEVMTAQSAHVDAVTGATYTSVAYLRSLQAAIDAADIPES